VRLARSASRYAHLCAATQPARRRLCCYCTLEERRASTGGRPAGGGARAAPKLPARPAPRVVVVHTRRRHRTGVNSEIGAKTSAAANDMDEQVVAMDGGGMAAAMNGCVPSTCS